MSTGRLPNFFIIGAARSATSSLYFYLKEHPEIFMCPDKEAQFFGFFGTRRAHKSRYPTLESYMALFDGVRDEKIIGEATPTYLALPESAQAIHEYCPDARLLASLRNPVDRAFSYYEMSKSKGHETARSFEQWMDGNTFWMEGGGYADHLQRYIDLFGRERLKVVLFEDIQEQLQDTLADIHRFLGVTEIRPEIRPMAYNKGGRPRGFGGALIYRMTTNSGLNRMLRPFLPAGVVAAVHRLRNRAVAPGAMQQDTRLALIAHYRDDILRTQDIVGRDLGHWLDADR
jgi:hypothetical protein